MSRQRDTNTVQGVKMSALKTAIQNLVARTIQDMQQQQQADQPVQGTVASLNIDGTVNVQLSDGTLIQNVGAATSFTVGAQVIVISAQGVRTAVPYQ